MRNFRVYALKLKKLFETGIFRYFGTKNNLRGISMGILPIRGSSSLTLYPLLIHIIPLLRMPTGPAHHPQLTTYRNRDSFFIWAKHNRIL